MCNEKVVAISRMVRVAQYAVISVVGAREVSAFSWHGRLAPKWQTPHMALHTAPDRVLLDRRGRICGHDPFANHPLYEKIGEFVAGVTNIGGINCPDRRTIGEGVMKRGRLGRGAYG